jgi:hypothetical protein
MLASVDVNRFAGHEMSGFEKEHGVHDLPDLVAALAN